MLADKADAQPSPYSFPHDDQVVGPEGKVLPSCRDTPRSEAFQGLVVAVTPNEMVLEQVGRLAWHTTPTQVILVGAGPERYLPDPPCNDCSLLGLDHAHRDIGLAPREIETLGWKATSTAQLHIDSLAVPAAHRLTQGGQGLKTFATLFAAARPLVGLCAVGAARTALERSIDYARTCIQHGKPLAGHQLIQDKLARMACDVDSARLLCWRALAMVDSGQRAEAEAAMAKVFATEAAVRVTSEAIQIHGSNGIAVDTGIERLLRNARMATMPEGTSEMQRLIIGRGLTGVSAF